MTNTIIIMRANNINGEIKIFNTLPSTWNGINHYMGGFASSPVEVLEEEGFYEVVDPQYDPAIEELGELYLEDNKYYYTVIQKTWSETLAELKKQKLNQLKYNTKAKLENTDWYYIRKLDRNIDVPQEVEDERAIIQSGGTVNLANQIEDFTAQVKAVNANKTLWNNGLYQDIVMEYYFKFNDPNLAVSLAKNDARFGNVLNQVGMSMEEVTATDRYNTDQNALDRDIKANVAYVDDLLEGMEGDLDAETKEWVAREYTYKRWNDRYLRSQLLLATDPYSGNEEDLDTGFALQLAKGKVTQTEDGETEIQALLDMYLPKAQHTSYQDNMKMHAGKYRNDPEYAKELEEDLKDLRFTLYPQYDRNLKWSTIETGALNTINKAWGMQVDPGGTYGYVVDKIIDLNDALKAQSFLIDEGLNLNIENVVGSFAKDMMTAFGGSIARSQDYIEPTQNRRI